MSKKRQTKEKSSKEASKKPEEGITRRGFIKTCIATGIVGFGVATAYGSAMNLIKRETEAGEVVPDTFTFFASPAEVAEGKLWYVPKNGEKVKPEDFVGIGDGAAVIWRLKIPSMIMKLDKKKVKDATGMLEVDDGYIASYLAKCTHLCCIPSWKKEKPDEELIYCPCHDGLFDPFDNGKVIAGPPPAPLPKIALSLDDQGNLVGDSSDLNKYSYCGALR